MPEEMSLKSVKVICGWVEEGARKPAGAFKEQLDTDIAYFKEHGEMSDDLKDRLARGVAAHIAALEAECAPEGDIHEYDSPAI